MSFFNCLSMRFNPYYDVAPQVTEQDVEGLGFGSNYKGVQKVWSFEFDVETAVAGIDQQTLVDDLDLIPMISGLTESIKINNNVFYTKDKKSCNIVFILPDNEDTE